MQASTGLAAYCFVGKSLARQRAAFPYSGFSYWITSGSGKPASSDCDAEDIPQSGGMVPRDYAAKAYS